MSETKNFLSISSDKQLEIFRKFVETAGQGFGMAHLDGSIFFVNPALTEMLGEKDVDDVIGKPFLRYYPKEYQDKLQKEIIPTVMKEGHWSGELRLLQRSGREISVLENYFLIKDDEGIPLYLADVITDISERVRNLRELTTSLNASDRKQKQLWGISKAASAIQQARTREDIFDKVGHELSELGYGSMIFWLDDNKEFLEIVHSTYENKLLRAAEKLLGLSAIGHSIPIAPGGKFAQIMAYGEAYFSEKAGASMGEAIPKAAKPVVARAAAMLNIEQSIFAPIRSSDELLGLLLVTGIGMIESDTSAIEVFAHQISIALENTRLYEAVLHRAEQLDIEVQKRTIELKDSEQKYRAVVEKASDGIIVVQDNVIKFANQQFANMLRYEVDELQGCEFAELIPPEGAEELLTRFQKIREGVETPSIFETRLIRKNDQEVPIEVNANVIQYQGADADLVFLRDISERKQIEQHTRYQAEILKGVSDAIISVDENFVIQSWNEAAEQIYGWSEDEVIGISFGEIVKPDYIDKTRQQVIEEFTETGTFIGEVIHHRKDGTPFYIHGVVNSIKDDKGNTIAVVAVNRDITDRKETERELAQHMEELERFNRLAVGREQRVIELKQRVNELLHELGRDAEYQMSYLDER